MDRIEFIADSVCDFLKGSDTGVMDQLAYMARRYDNPNSFGVCSNPKDPTDSSLYTTTNIKFGNEDPPECSQDTVRVGKYHSVTPANKWVAHNLKNELGKYRAVCTGLKPKDGVVQIKCHKVPQEETAEIHKILDRAIEIEDTFEFGETPARVLLVLSREYRDLLTQLEKIFTACETKPGMDSRSEKKR